ncbi:MAG TPA: hypothetical protein DCF68_18155 [Cyanothece sp. UBA12306]|nr:hypothetical protein [Cyanothece sp. UBA12306]
MSKFEQSSNCGATYLSLATIPLLGVVLVAQSLVEAMMELGEASEEVFRGDRLPILNFPDSEPKEEVS